MSPFGAGRVLCRCAVARLRRPVTRWQSVRWLLSSPDPRHSSASSAGFPSLVSWIEANGGHCSKLYIKHSTVAGRSVHCRTAISSDERIVRIPRRLLLSTADCKQSDVGRLVDQSSKPFNNSQSYIAAFILQERAKAAQSFFHPFLASLPASFGSFPLLYSDESLSLLRGSMVVDMVEAQRSDVHSDYLLLMSASPPFSFSLDDFYTARLAVGSRVFGAQLSDEPTAESDAVLVPYVDLLNHSEQHLIHWSYEPALSQFTCRSLMPIEPAAEVTTTYGSRCNTVLLAHYGFALEQNDNNECQMQFGLLPHGREAEEIRMRKVRLLDRLEGELAEQVKWRVGVGDSSELSKLLSYLRLCEAVETDLWLLDDDSSGSARVKAIPVLSADNERRVWSSVLCEARRRITDFPVSLSKYELRATSSRAGGIERLCALTCAGELRVLDWFVRLADVCVEALSARVTMQDTEAALKQLGLSSYWKSLQPLVEQAGRRRQSARH